MVEHVLDRTSTGQPLSAALGDLVVVRLDEIPTSGYRWEVTGFDPAILAPSGDEFNPSAGSRTGGGGQHGFRFTVVGAGRTALRLVCRRPWEPETDAVEELNATVVVSTP